ncbi:hypothetical protein FHW69_001715 [Luteibacter sp. Sphag1AF]|uniref:hypothetical protein n=1 Tax=Luteibacter sp. Sphag1AF TaxID=2587031 RepID=UPI00160CC0C4|nr:hypothetical protein [Luteibacter sp. Sphag1AF]MBB3227114.1 hypothetical protein [Luteibacter sp. Sphag1AF]
MKSVMQTGLLALCLLASGAHAAAAKETAESARARLAGMAPSANIQCTTGSHGFVECTADGFDIAFSDCNADTSYGSIMADKSVTLSDAIDGKGKKAIAALPHDQFVCIAATATKNDIQRYYVKALPTDIVDSCKGSDLCKSYNAQPVQWLGPRTGKACQHDSHGNYIGDCASGWVDKDDVEAFSMGLKTIGGE